LVDAEYSEHVVIWKPPPDESEEEEYEEDSDSPSDSDEDKEEPIDSGKSVPGRVSQQT